MASAIRKAHIGSRLRPPPNAPVLLEEEATDLKGDIVTQGLKIINTAMPCHLNLHLVLFVTCLASVLHRSIIRSDNLIFVPCFAFPLAQAAFTRALCLLLALALCLSLPLPLPDSSTVRVSERRRLLHQVFELVEREHRRVTNVHGDGCQR